jgi:hypothetical protein
VEKYGRARQATDDSIIQRLRLACWVTKARIQRPTHTLVIFNTYSPPPPLPTQNSLHPPPTLVVFNPFSPPPPCVQQCSRELSSILRYTFISCLVFYIFGRTFMLLKYSVYFFPLIRHHTGPKIGRMMAVFFNLRDSSISDNSFQLSF